MSESRGSRDVKMITLLGSGGRRLLVQLNMREFGRIPDIGQVSKLSLRLPTNVHKVRNWSLGVCI